MKGFTRDKKFVPMTDYKKVTRKSRDPEVKTKGVRLRKLSKAQIKRFEQQTNERKKIIKAHDKKFPPYHIGDIVETPLGVGEITFIRHNIDEEPPYDEPKYKVTFKDNQKFVDHSSIEKIRKKRDGLSKGQRVQFDLIKKGDEVRVSFPEKLHNSEEEGHFGFVTGKKDGKVQVRIKKLRKTILIEPEFLKFVPPPMLEEKFSRLDEIGDDFALSTGDDADSTREHISDDRAKEFDNFFVKIKDGEIIEAYGFNGTGYIGAQPTRLETASEMLERSIV